MGEMIAVSNEHAAAFWLSERPRQFDCDFNSKKGPDQGKRANAMAYLDGLSACPCLCELPRGIPMKMNKGNARDLRSLFGLPLPLHVAVDGDFSRRNSSTLSCHVFPSAVPRRQFVPLSDSLLVASPEYTLLALATSLSPLELSVLVCLLCSIYTYDRSTAKRIPRRAVTSVELANRLLLACARTGKHMPRGFARLRSVLRFCFDSAASPAEIALGLRLSVPCEFGGYGLGPLEHNAKIDTSTAWSDSRWHFRYPDMLNRRRRVWIEYDSDEEHSDSNRHRKDSQRMNEIAACGYKLVTLNSGHYLNVRALDKEAMHLARMVGRKPFSLERDEVEKRERFRREVDRALDMFKSWALA